MDKGERRDLALINGIFADDSNGDNDTSDSDYEPVEKVIFFTVESEGKKIRVRSFLYYKI